MTIHSPPAVGGQRRLFLQLEGGALLAVATAFYAWGGAPWWIFAVLFFAPDIAFLAYFVGPRVGAFTYNVMHTTLAPATLVGVAVLYEYPALAIDRRRYLGGAHRLRPHVGVWPQIPGRVQVHPPRPTLVAT